MTQAEIAFDRVVRGLTPGTFQAKKSPYLQINLGTGPTISFKSADNHNSLYGEDVFGAIMDEASRQAEDAWIAVRSTLTSTRGPCVMIGNVVGKGNWFYRFCRRVEKGDEPNGSYKRITWRDAVEAGVLDIEEIEDAKRNMPEAAFQELYEAVASDDGGNPFGRDHIEKCLGNITNQPAVAYGIDLGKVHDYTVVIGLDEDCRVCHFSRWTGVPWRASVQRIHSIVGEDTPALVDSTGGSAGDPILEELQEDHGNFFGFNFSNTSKQSLMEGLSVSIQSHEIQFPDNEIRKELDLFEFERRGTKWFYSAPEGYHDDCVCSIALAREQFTTSQPGANVSKFMAREVQRLQLNNSSRNFDSEVISELMPWRKSPSEDLDNELTELYENTIRNSNSSLSNRLCSGCGNPVLGPTRVSDGYFTWHRECATMGIRN